MIYCFKNQAVFFPYNPSVFPNSLEWICFGSSSKFYELVWSIFLNKTFVEGAFDLLFRKARFVTIDN